jgi:hypothetical protein
LLPATLITITIALATLALFVAALIICHTTADVAEWLYQCFK